MVKLPGLLMEKMTSKKPPAEAVVINRFSRNFLSARNQTQLGAI
jgi:hypothetical protein